MMPHEETKKTVQLFEMPFNIYKMQDFNEVDLSRPFMFIANTDEEKSLICPMSYEITHYIEKQECYRCFRIEGVLDFSMTGVLAPIAQKLANKKIPMLAVSTYNTDYIFVRDSDITLSAILIGGCGYAIESDPSLQMP